jgi:putative ABC transport system substrate-binding protein
LRYRLNFRAFISLLGGAAAWPLAARAQPAQRIWRIGILAVSPPPSAMLNAFRDSLRERGYIEGQNLLTSVRSTDSFEANPAVATEFVRRNVDVVGRRLPPLPRAV